MTRLLLYYSFAFYYDRHGSTVYSAFSFSVLCLCEENASLRLPLGTPAPSLGAWSSLFWPAQHSVSRLGLSCFQTRAHKSPTRDQEQCRERGSQRKHSRYYSPSAPMFGASAAIVRGDAAGTALVLAQREARFQASPYKCTNMPRAIALLSPAASCLPRRSLHYSTLWFPPLSRNAAAVRQPRGAKGGRLCQAVLTSESLPEASVTSQAESQTWNLRGVFPALADASVASDPVTAAGAAVPESSTFTAVTEPGTLVVPEDGATYLVISALFVLAAIGLVTLTAGVSSSGQHVDVTAQWAVALFKRDGP